MGVSSSDLSLKKCVPCQGGASPLKKEEAVELLSRVQGWELSGKTQITREFKFKNFLDAMGFVNRVAETAEAEGHHPDIDIRYNRVKLVLSTHAIGGLSENDFILAAKIDRLN
jgi:4a-hydroxytetrahydrobiopterin dehydratase